MADRYWVSPNTIVQFSVAAQELTTEGLFFKPDGSKMYIIGSSGDDVNEYNLSTAWDISTAVYLQVFSISAQDTTPQSLFFKDDGTKMYMLGQTNNRVFEYNLSTAWDISTSSYLQNFSVVGQQSSPRGVFFKTDGTKMYVVGSAGNIHEYNLSTAWNITTATYLQVFNVSTQEVVPTNIFFKPDGLKMYVVGQVYNRVNEYNLSTAWNISTAVFLQNFSVSAQESTLKALSFKSDGTKMYVVGNSADSVFSYPLSTAWNIASVTIDTWNGTAGSKWALTSGGTGGETVPTALDDVFFDANSKGIVTVASDIPAMKSLNFTGFTGRIAGTGALLVGGNFTVSTGMSYGHSGTLEIRGTGTVITAGKAISSLFKINGSGITVTLGDALNVSFGQSILVDQGTFDTAGYNVTTANLTSAPGGTVITINLNASTVSLSINLTFTGSSNLTLNAGTSQININNANSIFAGNSKTFYNVTFTNTGAGGRQILGANTFNNLTLTTGAVGLCTLSIAANQTVNGTLTCSGSSAIARGFLFSNTLGTVRTITAAAVSATDCDFRDITIAGAAAPISPTRGGDCGGNSGITFPAAKNAYRVGTNGTWAGSSSWALTSGGTGNDSNFPLAQDTAIFNNDTALTGTLSLAVSYNIGSIDSSAKTTYIIFNFNLTASVYGSYTFGSGNDIGGTAAQTFSGRGTQTFTSAGKTITFPITVNKPAGAFELGDAYNSSSTITHTLGTFDAKTYNLTCTSFLSNNSNLRTINMGSGLWTLTVSGGSVLNIIVTNLTLNKNTANILLSDTSTGARTFTGGIGISYNKLTIGGITGISSLTLNSGTFTELASTKTVAHSIRLNAANAVSIGTWSVTGTVGNLVTLFSDTVGTRRTFTLTNSTAGLIDYLSVKDIGITSPNRFFVGANSTNGGNNLNVYFTSFPALDTGNMFFMFN